ncbi:zinc ribbon domain-containing protein [Methanobrevibacter sp.]|uniref:double zinc ribbon domain-containing protein n=1 Tax=Methanobrevibacter sp. TaxID=66852 RepID=UPI0026DF2B21|nr:zinc ribbon domain-containing protein [Methanobrevibacter sp.]MDO5823436.1 zinc ribbon domain-containing protein [Methanobrevibacter sp.]
MTLGNYCKKCGHRILPNNIYCPGCGFKTGYYETEESTVFAPPIHNIGFFNFPIDFSPFILSGRRDFQYEICRCGYLNDVNNEFCYMCGAKRTPSKLAKILKKKSKPKFNLDSVLCECGAVNSKEDLFCEMCGKQLQEEETFEDNNNYSNFNIMYKDSVFCFCGEENEKSTQFCKNCGLPLINYSQLNDVMLLCACSTLNDVNSSFCIECGENLTKENSLIVCVCGQKNPMNFKFCQNCERPLNPQRIIKSKIVCSCGEILDWNTEFCSNCGKNIKNMIKIRRSTIKIVKSLKSKFR